MSGRAGELAVNLFAELRRRNMFKVAMAYAALFWVVAQVTDVVVPALNLPEMINSIVVYIGIIGFPFVMIVTWAFELTPEGIKRSKHVDEEESIRDQSGQKLNYTIIGLLSVAVVLLLMKDVFYDNRATPENERTIAVMPFADMSADGSQEYFGDGIAEEILNLLVPLEELDVTSRTSSFALKGQNLLAPEIADRLNVNYIVEGSIRSDGDQVRVTAQLIDVKNDTHLWSDTYDRELISIFAIQDEISTAITNALQVELVGGEIVREAPTENMEAYALYLQGHQLFLNRGIRNLRSAIELLEQAVSLDPEFAEAWADLGGSLALIPGFSTALMSEYAESAFEAVNMAISLDPMNAQAWAVKGYIHEQLFQWKLADVAHKHAVELNPNNETAWLWLAGHYLETADLINAEVAIRRAIEIAPSTAINHGFLGRILLAQGRSEEAKPFVERAIEMGWGPSHIERAIIALTENDPEMAVASINGFMDYNPGMIRQFPVEEAIEAYFNAELQAPVVEKIDALLAEDANIIRLFGFLFNKGEHAVHEIRAGGNAYGIPDFYMPLNRTILSQAVVKDFFNEIGMIDYWRNNGFPSFCRPVGDDDFTCE